MSNKLKTPKSEKRRVGRPSKYRQEFCQLYLEHCARGGFVEDFAGFLYKKTGVIGICSSTIRDWASPESPRFEAEFSATKKTGDSLSVLYWTDGAREAREKGIVGFPQGIVAMILKNKAGFRDQFEHVGSGGGPLQIDVQRDRARAVLEDKDLQETAIKIAQKLRGPNETR